MRTKTERRGGGRIALVLALVGLSVAGGCSQPSESAPVEAPAAEAPPAPAPAEPAAKPPPAEAAEATDRVEDPTFELKLTPAGPYAQGKLGSFAVSLVPRGEYHINQDFPMSIAVKAVEGVALPKARLEKADAAEFDEQKARFDVPFTPSAAGEHRVECKVNFAVCTPETCVPDERTLALNLPVE